MSTSATYLLSEELKGRTVEEVKGMSDGDFLKLIGLEGISPARFRCVLIPFVALKRALK